MIKHYLFLISIVLLVGCNPARRDYVECGPVRVINSFPEEMELPETAPLSVNLTGCLNVVHADSLLICQMGSGDCFWKILSLNTGASLGSYTRKGHGHEEFAQMPSPESIRISNDSIFCDIFDSNSQTLYRYNLTESVEKQKLVFCSQQQLKGLGRVGKAIALSDSAYYIVKPHDNRGFIRSILTADGKEEAIACGNLNRVTAEEINVLSASRTVSPERNKVAEAMLRFGQINLYSLKKAECLTLSMEPELKSLSAEEHWLKQKRKKYFGYIHSNEKWFGTLYYNMSLNDFFSGTGRMSHLLFFDWDGNPLLRINIPYIATSFFVHDGSLYIFTNAVEEEKIYKYPFNNI